MSQSITGVSAQVRKIAETFRSQAEAQSKAITLTSQALATTTLTMNEDLKKVGKVAENLNSAIEEHDAHLTMLEQEANFVLWDLRDSLNAIRPGMRAATKTLENTADITGDPDIKETLATLRDTSAHVDAVAASAEHDALAIQKRLDEILKPAGFLKTLFWKAVEVVPPIVTAAK